MARFLKIYFFVVVVVIVVVFLMPLPTHFSIGLMGHVVGGKLFVERTGLESAAHPVKEFLAITPGIGVTSNLARAI